MENILSREELMEYNKYLKKSENLLMEKTEQELVTMEFLVQQRKSHTQTPYVQIPMPQKLDNSESSLQKKIHKCI